MLHNGLEYFRITGPRLELPAPVTSFCDPLVVGFLGQRRAVKDDEVTIKRANGTRAVWSEWR
jgi:hypothetical protein